MIRLRSRPRPLRIGRVIVAVAGLLLVLVFIRAGIWRDDAIVSVGSVAFDVSSNTSGIRLEWESDNLPKETYFRFNSYRRRDWEWDVLTMPDVYGSRAYATGRVIMNCPWWLLILGLVLLIAALLAVERLVVLPPNVAESTDATEAQLTSLQYESSAAHDPITRSHVRQVILRGSIAIGAILCGLGGPLSLNRQARFPVVQPRTGLTMLLIGVVVCVTGIWLQRRGAR